MIKFIFLESHFTFKHTKVLFNGVLLNEGNFLFGQHV